MGGTGEVTRPPVVPGVELGRLLARGGSAEVWEGGREGDGRRVAVKVARADGDALVAAVREASLAGDAADAHLVPVEACVLLTDGRVALVMPLLRGGSLAALVVARGHLAPGEVVTVLAPVAAAVGRLHRVGTVHGDLSPGNVLLDLDGRPSLADLGTARVVGEEPSAVWGTEGYLAPEVLMGGRPTPAADVYALGALGWLCLTGEPPGAPGLRPALADVCRAGAAGPLVEVVESAVAPHPEHRPSASALAWALFGAAEALPLHLVEGDDDVSAVTYRLRAVASRPLDEDPPAGRGRHARGPRGRPGPRPWLAGLAVVAGSVVLGVGVAVAVDLAGGAAAEPTTATPPRPAASPAPVAGATHSRTQAGGDPTTVRDAPSARPAALLEALARARAEAWRSGDPALLRGAESPGSPLLARDTAALEELARAGLRYEGLRYVVTDVAAQSQRGTSASVLARLGIDEYEVVGTGRPRPRPAVEGEEVLVELEWSGGRWRLATVRPPA